MEWTRTTDEGTLVEWTRSDGYATVRRRRRPDGEWVVRLDRLFQAPEGRSYRRERVADESDAVALSETWRSEAGGADDNTATD